MNNLNKIGIYGPQLSYTLEINKNPTSEYFIKNKLYGSWFMSEKYDGIRALWTGTELITRSFRPFKYVPLWFIELFPRGIPLDGEIYIPDVPFSHFSSLSITKRTEDVDKKWERVQYLIFDMPLKDYSFEKRLNMMKELKFKKPNIKIIDFIKIENIDKDFKKVNNFFDNIIKKNGEGVMLIKGSSHYESRRSRESLKYKKEYQGEAEVVQLCEGKGKYYQKLGKIKCRLPNGKFFYCGTGFSDAERNMYQFDKTLCINIDNDIRVPKVGDKISYTCMEIIEKTGVPRMSVYKGLVNV